MITGFTLSEEDQITVDNWIKQQLKLDTRIKFGGEWRFIYCFCPTKTQLHVWVEDRVTSCELYLGKVI